MIIPAAAGFWVEYLDDAKALHKDPVLAWDVTETGRGQVIVTPITIWGRIADFLDVIGPGAPTA